MPNRQQSADSKGLQFIDIDDFTPGIYDASNIAFSSPTVLPGPFVAPIGSADAAETWQCIALAQGGLGPAPAMIADYDLTQLGITSDLPVVGWLVGLLNTLVTNEDEFVVCIEYLNPDNALFVWSAVLGTSDAALIYSNVSGTNLSRPAGCAFPFATRVAPTNPTTTVGEVVIVFPDNTSPGEIVLYPDPANPTVRGTTTLSGSSPAGTLFGHQSRIVCLQNVALSWPVTPTIFSNNDAINYTDPPNSETYPGAVPSIIFAAEEPYGYGATGSVSAGELFMVKCRGGGIVVQGDINNPTVTYLPGVKPTGVIYGRCDTDENGFYYCTDGAGAWIWNGGNASSRISTQLDDNFYQCADPIPNQNFAYFIQRWHDFMLFSNNWLYNTQTGGWWRLLNPATASIYWWVPAFLNNQMYGAVPALPDFTTKFLYRFDDQIPASQYRWQSLPLRVTEDKYVDMREVVVRFSAPYGGDGTGATCSIQISSVSSAGVVTAVSLITFSADDTPNIQMMRLNIPGSQGEDLRVRIDASTTGGSDYNYAPVIHSLSLGYRPRQHAVSA